VFEQNRTEQNNLENYEDYYYYLDQFNQLESLYAASTGVKQRCSRNRGERGLSFQDVVSLGIVQPTLGGAEHMHLS